MISVRKNRLELRPGTYCGQTTPTVRMRVIVSRRTRASHSSQAFVAKLWSMVSPRPHRAIRASPNPGRKTKGGDWLAALSRSCRRAGEARLVVGQLSDKREQRQVHRNNHAAHHQAEKYNHDGFESG